MNWDHLKAFLAVARAGSALAAAQQLQINHATVIRRIDTLEQELSGSLFRRLSSGYRLTDLGMRLLPQAQQMEQAALELQLAARGQQQVAAGPLSLALPESALFDLSALLHRFTERFPQVELWVESGADIRNLNRMEADIALRLTDHPPENLVGREITRVGFAVYAHIRYLQRFQQLPTPEQCHWLLWRGSRNSPIIAARHPDEQLQSLIPGLQIVLRATTIATTLAGIKAGSGVGLISRQQGQRDPELVELPFNDLLRRAGIHDVGLWLLTHPEMRQSPRVRAFIDQVNSWHWIESP